MTSRIDDAKVGVKVGELVHDLRRVAEAVRTGTSASALAVVRDEIGLGGAMGLLDSSRAGEGGSSHLDDLEALAQVAALHPDAATFEPWLRGVLRREPSAGGVTLSTIHRVKGREWGRVVVFGATAGLMPHRLAEDVEEERRVLHVAITRGRRRVALLGDASRPSPFLAELDGTAPHEAPRPTQRPPSAAPATRGPREAPAPLPADAEATEAALRGWRTVRARRDAVPPYIVLSDKYLRGVAVARPRSLVALRTLPGIGPTKLDLYGEEILAVIAEANDEPA
jgi:DNA helicase-2/ATP-dependent DNA helicase PcrA